VQVVRGPQALTQRGDRRQWLLLSWLLPLQRGCNTISPFLRHSPQAPEQGREEQEMPAVGPARAFLVVVVEQPPGQLRGVPPRSLRIGRLQAREEVAAGCLGPAPPLWVLWVG
jgi:hypothetical protein